MTIEQWNVQFNRGLVSAEEMYANTGETPDAFDGAELNPLLVEKAKSVIAALNFAFGPDGWEFA
jgi:hypothetical protein